ncbi:stalk domain-containing protein [Paenibacillus sp. LHD-117]|uniref:stalk domain-containing protein n=1 Tax=Paenibacillus sp. LHD-117 TaxID=3071412 RepID=UPI0027E0EE62|nr:stalk domain-containing protein [Paenibacillus sp. LHD-117]MDQ6420815.1 stalk domain-containing protein [Paenibacillus sp. LHD-117]
MRKYIIAFLCGIGLTTVTAVYAGDAIRATLFPVKYEVNGNSVELPEGFETLNYNSRAYVPIRFVAESLDAVVVYDEDERTIRLDNEFHLRSIASELRAGHVKTEKQGKVTKVTAQLYAGQAYWSSLYTSKTNIEPGNYITVSADLAFYDEEGAFLARVPVNASCTAEGDQLMDVAAETSVDLSEYAFVTLEEVRPEPIYSFMPPNLAIVDPTGMLAIGQPDMLPSGDFTKIRVQFSFLQQGYFQVDATIAFYGDDGRLLGTADLKSEGTGTGIAFDEPGELHIYTIETVGKGDFSNASGVKLTVNKIMKRSEVLTKQEMYDFQFLRADWTKERFEKLGSFEKVVNEPGAETTYRDEDIRYIFMDRFSAITTPSVIEVYGDVPGPRGIRVGDSFDEVLALFTQDDVWKSNELGLFFGQFDSKESPIGGTGYVSVFENGQKEITLISEDIIPFFRIFMKDDVVTHYTFFMVGD